MSHIIADLPVEQMPSWAIWQRHLFDSMDTDAAR